MNTPQGHHDTRRRGGRVAGRSARAQQPERMRRIGVLMGNAESDDEGKAGVAAFRDELRPLGSRGPRLRPARDSPCSVKPHGPTPIFWPAGAEARR